MIRSELLQGQVNSADNFRNNVAYTLLFLPRCRSVRCIWKTSVADVDEERDESPPPFGQYKQSEKHSFFFFSFLFFFFATDKGHWTRAWPLNFARERCRRLAANHPVPTCGLIKKNDPNSGKYHKNEETRCVMRKIIQSCKTIYSNKKIIY